MSQTGILGSPAANPTRLEEFRESWQRQLIADRRIPMSALKVGLAIGWYLNRKKGWAWPSIGRLDKDTGLSSRTVIRAVKWLETHGYVRVLRTCEGKRRQVNRYRPILERPVPNVANVAKFEKRDDAGCQGGSDKAVSVGTDKAMSHEPLNEPLIQYSPSTASVSTDANKEVGEEGLEARCYRLARSLSGERGAKLATLALQNDTADTVWQDLCSASQTGEDLGYVLWRPQ